jgi:hypothetical protein
MSIFFDYTHFSSKKIQLKTPFKKLINTEQFFFVQMRTKGHEIYIKTPKITVPFGLGVYDTNCYYYVLSFSDIDIDPNINNFYEFIQKTEKFCQSTVKKNLELWGSTQTFDSLRFKSSLKDCNGTPLFRLKITPNVTEIYDEKGSIHNLTDTEHLITAHCQIISLIEMNNIWLGASEYGITWKVHQIKIYPTTRPIGGISLLDETVEIHDVPPPVPPPPPPPLPTHKIPMIPMMPMLNCMAMINLGNFDLKKVDPLTKIPRKIDTSLQPKITLDEILNIRRNLKKNIN